MRSLGCFGKRHLIVNSTNDSEARQHRQEDEQRFHSRPLHVPKRITMPVMTGTKIISHTTTTISSHHQSIVLSQRCSMRSITIVMAAVNTIVMVANTKKPSQRRLFLFQCGELQLNQRFTLENDGSFDAVSAVQARNWFRPRRIESPQILTAPILDQ